MNKKEIAAIFEEIATLLELSGENPFKARSYVNAARAIEQCEEDIETLVREKRLRELRGIGQAIEEKLTELITTGKLEYREKLRSQFCETLFELFRIPGLGAKRIKTLYADLNIRSMAELEQACVEGRIAPLKGFGEKMQQKILEGIAFARQHEGLFHVHRALQAAETLRDWLSMAEGVVRIEVAGSLRRRKEVVKDIDILASSDNAAPLMDRFAQAPNVLRVTGKGDTKTSVVLVSGIAADLRVVTDEQFPYALHHFTGSREHNVAMRQRAKDRGLKMNEYGLFRDDALIRCKDEMEIFAALDLPYIPPELREDMGEFELTATPRLVEQSDLVGLIHVHSTYSDGTATIAQMAEAARLRGYQYMVLADHSQTAAYAGGLTVDAVRKQHAEIDALNKTLKDFRVFKCIESDIRADGSLDYSDDVLRTFELIVASVHSGLNMTKAEATRRVLKAVENPYTSILGHPTGRLLLSRTGYELDVDKVVDACIANRVAIEINANPHRLDMDWRHIRRARDKGALFSIGPDAHSIEGIDDTRYGIGIARKGWLGPEHLINCMTAERLLAWRKGG